MKNNRMFLIEKGMYVVIRDGKKEVSFTSFEEFNEYYPSLDLTGKDYIDYEPDREIYIDNMDESISIKNAPVAAYETVIDNIDILIENKNDPYFNLDLIKSKEFKKSQIKFEESQTLYETWPIHKQINAALGIYGEDVKQQCITAIQSSITSIDAKEIEIDKSSTKNNIKNL